VDVMAAATRIPTIATMALISLIFSIFMQRYYQKPPKTKTYGRFFGAIYFEGAHWPEDFAGQQLVNAKNHQNVKKCKIKCFFPRANTLFSCQNAQK